jgi:hypothetical protein
MIERVEFEPGTVERPEPQHAARLHDGGVPAKEDAAVGAAAGPAVAEPAPSVRKKPRWGGRVAWLVSMTAIGGVLGVLIVMGMKFIDGPVVVKPETSLKVLQASATPKPSVSELAGLYVDLVYPGVFDQVGQVKNDAQALEQFNISSKSDYSRTIAVSVRKLPSNNVNDDSGYRFRLINPQDYTQKVDKLNGEVALVMAKTDKTERTLFWAHKQMILAVSITSNNPHDDLEAFMATIESKLRWRS